MKNLAVIGGGASGLAAGIEAARAACAGSEPVRVTVYEAAERIGKSILATGNGRCNVSNARIDPAHYRNADFVARAFEAAPPHTVHAFLESLGLMMREEGEGRLYPLTGKASSVLDVLRLAVDDLGIDVVCGCEVIAVTGVRGRYLVAFGNDTAVFADAVVVACGGTVARSVLPLGHSFEVAEPVLGPVATDPEPLKGLDNVRVRCTVSLARAEGVCCVREEGEVLFRTYGISGIAAFNVSRHAQRGDTLTLDLIPQMDAEELASMVDARRVAFAGRSAVELFAGMLLAPVARAVLKAAGVSPDKPLQQGMAAPVAAALKNFPLTVWGRGEVRQCQVRRGGFAVEGFDPATMAAKGEGGLFVVGEALDVDGPCGGFNLHWAWASGMLAGRAAVQGINAAERCGG